MNGKYAVAAVFATVAISAATTSCAAVSDKPYGQRELTARVSKESGGLMKVVSYTKVNGREHDLMGAKTYDVQYQAVIEFTDNCYWSPDWVSLGGFYVRTNKEPQELGDYFANVVSARKGERITISGALSFEKTDNGWLPAEE